MYAEGKNSIKWRLEIEVVARTSVKMQLEFVVSLSSAYRSRSLQKTSSRLFIPKKCVPHNEN